MRTLLAHLSHLPGFNIVSSCFFVGIPCLQTRTLTEILQHHDAKNMFIEDMTHHARRRDTCCSLFRRKKTRSLWRRREPVVLNRVSFEILNCEVPRELCRWPTVCPRMDTRRPHDFVRHQSCLIKVCGSTCGRHAGRTHFVTCILMCLFPPPTVVSTTFVGIHARGTPVEHISSRTDSVGCAKSPLLLRCSHVVAVADEVQVR